jgi:hypothetical protein
MNHCNPTLMEEGFRWLDPGDPVPPEPAPPPLTLKNNLR